MDMTSQGTQPTTANESTSSNQFSINVRFQFDTPLQNVAKSSTPSGKAARPFSSMKDFHLKGKKPTALTNLNVTDLLQIANAPVEEKIEDLKNSWNTVQL